MRKSIIISLALLSVLFSAQSSKLYAQQNDTPFIELVGKASKEIAPDRIYLQISINEKDFKNKSLTVVEKDLINALKSLGIDTEKDLVVKDMESNFQYYFLKGNNAKLSKDYELVVADAQMVAKVIVKLQSMGISNVNLTKAENSKIEEYRDEVRVLAIQDAQRRANLLTSAIGQQIGKAIYIYEQNFSVRSFNTYNVQMKTRSLSLEDAIAEEYEAPSIEFEKIKIEASIDVKFELK